MNVNVAAPYHNLQRRLEGEDELAGAQLINADILMIDDSTGHLDAKNVQWVKNWLGSSGVHHRHIRKHPVPERNVHTYRRLPRAQAPAVQGRERQGVAAVRRGSTPAGATPALCTTYREVFLTSSWRRPSSG